MRRLKKPLDKPVDITRLPVHVAVEICTLRLMEQRYDQVARSQDHICMKHQINQTQLHMILEAAEKKRVEAMLRRSMDVV